MMECPNCEAKARVIRKKKPECVEYIVHRVYQCTVCKFQFKTSEKLLYSTLPLSVRINYMQNGRKKK